VPIRVPNLQMSNRVTLAAAVLIGIALLPTVRHTYFEMKADDGYSATAIDSQLAGMRSRPTDRLDGWVKKTFDSDDWVERRYEKPGGGYVTLFVTRSYDLKRLYHHPELAVAYGTDLRDDGTEALPHTQGVTLHVLRGEPAHGVGLAAYALAYSDEFVNDPYTFQIRLAGELVFTARRAMTLFFALDEAASYNARLADQPLTQVLGAAIRSFQSQTPFTRNVHPDATAVSRLGQ
jgi:hypothetical protein